ncbi:hypothetical protein N7535_000995 [Penicillium sp. DV-2018c]|nr:hypothetical protein N7461_005762 [Penicillium sp. DV-2018c]KAJ5582375.1 hypothetical protein N7535_000995 [Penicillium sp. DV-2018c]
MGPLERLMHLMEKDEGLMNLSADPQNKGEGTGPAQQNAESLPVSEPVVDPVTETFSELQATTKDLVIDSNRQDVDSPHNTQKSQHECPSTPQDKHDGAHSEKTSEGQLTVVSSSSFVPATAMARFFMRYVPGHAVSETVNEKFYKGEKFWKRTWNLYYLLIPKETWRGPLLLIPISQAQGFLDEINSALNLQLTLTGRGLRDLVLDFNGAVVQPTFLGMCNTPSQKTEYEKKVQDLLDVFEGWTGVDEEFVERIKQCVAELRRLKAKRPNPNREAQRKKWQNCMGQMQAYFGLRPPLQADHEQPSLPNGQIEPVDVWDVTKWEFHKAPIFISLDLEWKENSPGALTEVGISTLDMMDLQRVPPGDYGANWIKRIRSRHLRVTEYRTWVNHRYCRGCPDGFGFGESEIIPGAKIPEVVDAAFQPPYMVPKENEPVPEYKNQKRTVILVGVDLRYDFRLLKEHRSRVFWDLDHVDGSSAVVQEVVDVAQLYRVQHDLNNAPGLETMLRCLNLPTDNLHNAGNDASYTLQALVRLMLKVAGEKPDTYPKHMIGNANVKDEREGATSEDVDNIQTN